MLVRILPLIALSLSATNVVAQVTSAAELAAPVITLPGPPAPTETFRQCFSPAIDPSGRFLAGYAGPDQNRTAEVRDRTGRPLFKIERVGGVPLAFRPDGKRLVHCDGPHGLRILDTQSREEVVK